MKLSGWDKFTMSLAPRWTLRPSPGSRGHDMRWRVTTKPRHAGPAHERLDAQRGDADIAIRVRSSSSGSTPATSCGTTPGPARPARDREQHRGLGHRAEGRLAENASVARKAMELWNAWAKTTECESEGRHTFYGLQHLAMKTIVESGEVLFRRRWRAQGRTDDPAAAPDARGRLSRPLEASFREPGRRADHPGVEFDKIGRRAAYWLFARTRGAAGTPRRRRVPASEVCTSSTRERPGQSRGVSWFAAAIVNLKDSTNTTTPTLDEAEDRGMLRRLRHRRTACPRPSASRCDDAHSSRRSSRA
jgi:hypothetical protein